MSLGFKAPVNVDIDGQAQIIQREPGIYKVTLDNVKPGSKRAGKDEPETPTLDLTFRVKEAVYLFDKQLNPASLVGKTHTEQIKLNADTQEKFERLVSRLGHVLSKAGIAKEAIVAIVPKDWKEYQEKVSALFNPEEHKKQAFLVKITGSVFQGNAFVSFPNGYIGWATTLDKEQKFSANEVKDAAAYYAALNGAAPSAEGGAAGGSDDSAF